MKDILLGKKAAVPSSYDPSILHAIPRRRNETAPHGFDLWRSYELSWLNPKGKPEVAILELVYPADSRSIVESKSLKLYLGSLSNTSFSSPEEIESVISRDLGNILFTPWIDVSVYKAGCESNIHWEERFPGVCIDELDIEVRSQGVDPGLLFVQEDTVHEILHTHLLKSHCPITRQPDWGSVLIEYRGRKINHEGLLAYLCSYRNHEGFAEECCERIFLDLSSRCKPEELLLGCFYTRRGGIDINPVRCSHETDPDEIRKYRLVRQ